MPQFLVMAVVGLMAFFGIVYSITRSTTKRGVNIKALLSGLAPLLLSQLLIEILILRYAPRWYEPAFRSLLIGVWLAVLYLMFNRKLLPDRHKK